MSRREVEEMPLNLTAMIDVVFQLLIFFVVTSDLQNSSMGANLALALAPNGPQQKEKNPLTVYVDVDALGRIYLADQAMSKDVLKTVLQKTIADRGGIKAGIPVVIRGDRNALHESIKNAMDACSEAGVKQIKFAAIREQVKKQ